MKRKTIMVTDETKGALDSVRHRGQSYDGLLQELVEFWKKGHQKEGKKPDSEAKDE